LVYSFSFESIKKSILTLHESGASDYFKTFLTLKHFGLSMDRERSVEVDTSNTRGSLRRLFEVSLLTGTRGNKDRPFYDPLTNECLKNHAARSVVQTHCKRFHDKSIPINPSWLISEQTPEKRWKMSFAPQYPKGLGAGKNGMAYREDKQITIDAPSFVIWYFRYEQSEEKPHFKKLFERMQREMNFHNAEIAILFNESRDFSEDPFVSEAVDEEQLASFVCNEAGRHVSRIGEFTRPKLSEETVVSIIDRMGLSTRAFEVFVNRTYLEREFCLKLDKLLREKKQIIFYGPPGTGKTFVAKELASYFAGISDNIKLAQFHPSYGYEDFVEGIRPEPKGSQISYVFSEGVLRRLAHMAHMKKDQRFVLIIDEINRGNVAKIFGEVIHCIEYRGEENSVVLPYSQRPFFIPQNVFIIGTMNSADRSIALVDYALRRRFYFVDLVPDTGLLSRWFEAHPPRIDRSKVIDFLETLNARIRENEKLGKYYEIGHSYFMQPDLDISKLKDIWTYAILPLLEEYYFGEAETLQNLQKLFSETFGA